MKKRYTSSGGRRGAFGNSGPPGPPGAAGPPGAPGAPGADYNFIRRGFNCFDFWKRNGYLYGYTTVTFSGLVLPVWELPKANLACFLLITPIFSRFWKKIYVDTSKIFLFGNEPTEDANPDTTKKARFKQRIFFVPTGQNLDIDVTGVDTQWTETLTTAKKIYGKENVDCPVNVPAGAIGTDGLLILKFVRDFAHAEDTYNHPVYCTHALLEIKLEMAAPAICNFTYTDAYGSGGQHAPEEIAVTIYAYDVVCTDTSTGAVSWLWELWEEAGMTAAQTSTAQNPTFSGVLGIYYLKLTINGTTTKTSQIFQVVEPS